MKFLITKTVDLDLKNIPNDLKSNIVSFDKSVLDIYRPDQILLDENAGALQGNGWSLQIDVGDNHISTFLHKLSSLPEEDAKHFQSKNILPMRLGNAAYRRWINGTP